MSTIHVMLLEAKHWQDGKLVGREIAQFPDMGLEAAYPDVTNGKELLRKAIEERYFQQFEGWWALPPEIVSQYIPEGTHIPEYGVTLGFLAEEIVASQLRACARQDGRLPDKAVESVKRALRKKASLRKSNAPLYSVMTIMYRKEPDVYKKLLEMFPNLAEEQKDYPDWNKSVSFYSVDLTRVTAESFVMVYFYRTA